MADASSTRGFTRKPTRVGGCARQRGGVVFWVRLERDPMLGTDPIPLRKRPRPSRVEFVLFSAFRAIVVLLAVQLSGMGHAAADLLFLGDDASEHGDCSSEEPGRDCPPGCPTCHHANGGVGALPRQQTFFAMPEPPRETVLFTPAEADAPRGPDLPSIFRPPKLV